MSAPTEQDWLRAGDRLRDLRTAYAAVGTAGTFALMHVLMPLTARFENGERSQELYDEILAVKL